MLLNLCARILQILHTHGTLSMFTAALTIANPMGLQSVQSDLPSIFWKSATVNILTSMLLFSTSAIFPGIVYRPLHNAFFSRKTRTFLPVTKPLLQPVIHTDVKETITKQRLRGKEYYDRNAHQLLALKPRQTVRMQTARGFDRLAIVNSPAEQPNSYVVTSQGTKYIRNRWHLLHISESPPVDLEDDLPVVTDAEALSTPPNSEGSIQQPQSPKMDCYGDTDGKCSVVTHSGRVSCPNRRFKDYVMTWLKCAITLCSFMYDIHVRWYCAARCLPVFAPVFLLFMLCCWSELILSLALLLVPH